MNDIEILELLSRKIKEQNSIIVSCSSIVNKKAEAKERTEYIEIKRFVENLIQRNKDLEQILELTSKSLDNISYDQIPIAIEELKFKLQNLEQIEKEHKEENGRLRGKVKKYETMIINHKKQLSKSGIYGYDYDLKILEESEK